MPFKGGGDKQPNLEAMYDTLCLFWNAVRDAFPEAWGKPSTKSRLMHGAGIRAMGLVMDHMMARAAFTAAPEKTVREAMKHLAPHCRWTEGCWEETGLAWDQPQVLDKDIKQIANQLIRLDFEGARSSL